MSLLLEFLLWLGVAALYAGFAGVMGVLLNRTLIERRPQSRALSIGHAALIFIPASLLMLRMPMWPVWFRLLVLVWGLTIVWLGMTQPTWAPDLVWRSGFGHRYFAGSMLLTASWALCLTWLSPAIPPLMVAAAALGAAVASISSAPRLI